MRLKENEIIDTLANQTAWCEPLVPVWMDREVAWAGKYDIDAIIEFSISGGPSFRAAVEILTLSTPKVISQKSKILKNLSSEFSSRKLIPMIVAPYIGNKQSKILLEEGISWIDLSGNMLISIPSGIYIERTGNPNKFPDTAPIKKVFQGTSSLVSRALLLKPEGFSTQYEIVDFINSRNGNITLGTVSKVLKSLEDDLLITRKPKIVIKRPQQLLENLTQGYSDYSKRNNNSSYKYDVDNIDELCTVFYEAGIDYAYCGFYAAQIMGLGVTEQITLYLNSIKDLKKALQINSSIVRPDEEFGPVTFIETKNPCVWFNAQGGPFDKRVDDLELYLEMVNDQPRGPKIAKQLKERILGILTWE
ncbi:MAG: hypothetical protein K9M57_00895 [Phycisphaerae bacterium]|nr:hypothetical protein [Phycisphaerae bacterium]